VGALNLTYVPIVNAQNTPNNIAQLDNITLGSRKLFIQWLSFGYIVIVIMMEKEFEMSRRAGEGH